MTLAELIQKADECQRQFNTAHIPLKFEGHDVNISFNPAGSNETGWVINIRIENNE